MSLDQHLNFGMEQEAPDEREINPGDDMSEGDIWREHKEERRTKKLSNLEQSINILRDTHIEIQQFSPVHFRVKEWDFWPSTGKFWNRITGEKGRGVFNLIKRLKPVMCIECGYPNKIIDQCGRCGGPIGECCPDHERKC